MIPTLPNIKSELEKRAREWKISPPTRQEELDVEVRDITYKYLTTDNMIKVMRKYYDRCKFK